MASQPCGQHTVSIPSRFPHSRRVVPPFLRRYPSPPIALARTPLPPVESTAVQRIQHVVVGAGSAARVAGVQHVTHVQPTALGATGGGGRWGRGCGCASRWRLQGGVRRVRRGRMAHIVGVSTLRRGATIMRRRRVVGARGGVCLVSGSSGGWRNRG